MDQLIVVSFDSVDDARRALGSLRTAEHGGGIAFEDTAIVSRDADGKTHVHNEVSGATETGAAVGGAIGAIVTFAFPVVGLAVGAAVGAAVGSFMHRGVESSFVDEVKDSLPPGKSALFLVVRAGNTAALAAALRPYEGEVIQTTLDPDYEESIRRALQ
jgi:uncharacterized membrane protein